MIMQLYIPQWYILLPFKNNLSEHVNSIQNNVGIEEYIDYSYIKICDNDGQKMVMCVLW